MEAFLAGFVADLPERPKALLVISGHWEEKAFTVQDGVKPGLLYDYHGFPEHTYHLRWDAPGAPDVAHSAAALLREAGLDAAHDAQRGWDHGVFVPLKVAVPGADIPTAQLSLRGDLDPAAHIAAGRALAPLRDEGVLIVGSGMSFHNMRVRNGDATGPADQFDAALSDVVADPDTRRRASRLAQWETLPYARFAHPREEHLIPLMVAAGAGGDDAGTVVFGDHVIGWKVSGYRFG